MNKPLLVIFAAFLSCQAHAKIIERVVAIANDKIVTEKDLKDLDRKLHSKGMIDELLADDPTKLEKDPKAKTTYLIDERIIDSEVKKNDLEITYEKVEQEVQNIATRNNLTKAQLKAALKEQGMDFADYQELMKKRLERQSLVDKVITSKIRISDDEVAAHYLASRGTQGKETFEYSISQILFLPKGGDIDAAKRRAESVFEKLQTGGSFETLAQNHSEDPAFTNGGLLGSFKTGEFLKEMEDAVKPLTPGATSGIIRTKTGFHILKLLGKKLVADEDLERNKEEIRAQLLNKAFKRQFQFWLEQKRADAFVKINASREALPDQK
ncbi:MAG: peptidylprolyl isomerase [Bdellovibrionales bacterium]|nr:peptidylprolyl isomerase [Bdellovibrionales bacterium]